MKITKRNAIMVSMPFAKLSVGDVFRLFGNDWYTYIKTNDTENNSICLESGDICFMDEDDKCVLLDAELIVSEVIE